VNKNGVAVRAEGVDSGKEKSLEFLAYTHVSRENWRDAAISKRKKPITTRGTWGASQAPQRF